MADLIARKILEAAAGLPELVRARAPRVHCLTNHAAAALTANMLLAVGAIPSLTDHPDEMPDFIGGADALMVNLGTPDSARVTAVEMAIEIAKAAGKPWVLDPVMCERGAARLRWSKACLGAGPSLIRLNQAEADALGLDLAGAETRAPLIALTGAEDRVIGMERSTASIGNGHPLMAKVTAIGCGLSAVLAAYLAVSEDAFTGVVAGLLAFGIAGEDAGERVEGPGGFPAALLDRLYRITAADILEKGKLTCAN